MDFIIMFIGEKYLEAIGWTLIHASWQVTLVSLLLWLIMHTIPKKSSQWRYAAALAALIFILIVSCWTFIFQLHPSEKGIPAMSLASFAHEDTNFISSSDSLYKSQSLGNLFVSQLTYYLPLV